MSAKVYLALDFESRATGLAFAEKLCRESNADFGFKINLDTLLDFSPNTKSIRELVLEYRQLGRDIFLDLKMWNGSRTMSQVAGGAAELGVKIINVYGHAGVKFISEVKRALAGSETLLFGLTVLTHYSAAELMRIYGKVSDQVLIDLARINHEAGVDGIILPATKLALVSDLSLLKLCPGIRPTWFADKAANNQEETATPEYAYQQGANYIVVGTPVLKAPEPARALERIVNEFL